MQQRIPKQTKWLMQIKKICTTSGWTKGKLLKSVKVENWFGPPITQGKRGPLGKLTSRIVSLSQHWWLLLVGLSTLSPSAYILLAETKAAVQGEMFNTKFKKKGKKIQKKKGAILLLIFLSEKDFSTTEQEFSLGMA